MAEIRIDPKTQQMLQEMDVVINRLTDQAQQVIAQRDLVLRTILNLAEVPDGSRWQSTPDYGMIVEEVAPA